MLWNPNTLPEALSRLRRSFFNRLSTKKVPSYNVALANCTLRETIRLRFVGEVEYTFVVQQLEYFSEGVQSPNMQLILLSDLLLELLIQKKLINGPLDRTLLDAFITLSDQNNVVLSKLLSVCLSLSDNDDLVGAVFEIFQFESVEKQIVEATSLLKSVLIEA